MKRTLPFARSSGFTLIELLVVVSIIALLIAILLPSLKKARDQGKTTVCLSNLHQLALTTTYYTENTNGRLPYILGSPDPGNDGQPTKAPFYQYHQLFNFWPFLKNLKAFQCPSALGDNSVRAYTNDGIHSYYTVFKSDELYLEAYEQRWWPNIDPYDYAGDTIDPLYTEYWFNDWSWSASSGGNPIPQISGGLISKIPLPNLAVIMCDAVWETLEPRHSRGNNFAFLDAHVERVAPRARYLDDRGESNYDSKTDKDPFGNRPFYAWGLTRDGFDAAP